MRAGAPEPGSFAGKISSPVPHRGPEASQRMSLAIFINGTARARSPAEGTDHGVQASLGGELVFRGAERLAGQFGDLGGDCLGETGRAFSPVPTAVPLAASSYSPSADAVTRSMAWVSWWAYRTIPGWCARRCTRRRRRRSG
jgi:hypothetical protein